MLKTLRTRKKLDTEAGQIELFYQWDLAAPPESVAHLFSRLTLPDIPTSDDPDHPNEDLNEVVTAVQDDGAFIYGRKFNTWVDRPFIGGDYVESIVGFGLPLGGWVAVPVQTWGDGTVLTTVDLYEYYEEVAPRDYAGE